MYKRIEFENAKQQKVMLLDIKTENIDCKFIFLLFEIKPQFTMEN